MNTQRVCGLTLDVMLKGLYTSPTLLQWLLLAPIRLFVMNSDATDDCRSHAVVSVCV